MMDFDFYSPVRLVFGRPVADVLPDTLAEIGASRVLLISDPGLAQLGLTERIAGLLRDGGWQVSTFSQVRTNPTVGDVEAALAVAREAGAQALVALGGGSVIDVGKAVGLLMTHRGRYADYQWRGEPILHPILPLIAVPTTAGTGSEMTRVMVIEDEETHFKRGVLSPHLFARVAIVDPQLTASLPPKLTAATGADVLGHALEAYVGRRANPLTDALALAALRRAWRSLPRATQQGDDTTARSEMALASALAGVAFDQSGLGIIHALAGPLAAHYSLHHGLCIGLLLPYGLAYNLPALASKRAGLLEALGMPASLPDREVVEQIRAWLQDLGLPTTLHELDIVQPDLSALAEGASHMAMMPNNPRPATAEECRQILEELV
jgi:alcohol dehydrogenase